MTDSNGISALMFACRSSSVECAMILLEEAGKVDTGKRSALMYAAESGCIEMVSVLRDKELRI